MKKEEIVALGIAEEVADKIVTMSSEELKGYIPKSRFDEVNEAKKNAEALLKERDGQLETLKKSTDTEELKKQIEELQTVNKTTISDYESKIRNMQIDHAVQKALTESGARNLTAAKALLTGMDKAKLLDDGTIEGLADQIKALAKDDKSSFLFNTEPGKPAGATPAQAGAQTPPAGTDSYSMRLAEARKAGDNLAAIHIKREAAENGIALL